MVAAATRARSRVPDIEIALDLTSVWVSGRPAALQRAVLNLIDNAGKWSPADQPVQVRLRAEGAWAVLEVDDAGPGIDAADVPRVFDRFYRAQARLADPVWGCRSGGGVSTTTRRVTSPGPHRGWAAWSTFGCGPAAPPAPIERPSRGGRAGR